MCVCGLRTTLALRRRTYRSDPNWPHLPNELRAAESFAEIRDTQARSIALFEEAAKVLQHPPCMNCHPAGERPRQTDLGRLHQPLVVRGKDGHGVAGMACATCHGGANFDHSRVPGDPHWALAPATMAWEGKTVAEICAQLKDSATAAETSPPS